MRYRVVEKKLDRGWSPAQLVLEAEDGTIWSWAMRRVAEEPVSAASLEEVTPEMFGLGQAVDLQVGPVQEAPDRTKPMEIFRQAIKVTAA